MAKQPKPLTRAEKVLLSSINAGNNPGPGDNGTADKLTARGLIEFKRGRGKGEPMYTVTKEGTKHVRDI